MRSEVEYAVFGALMCANLGFGLYFSCARRVRKQATTEEMFLGSRSLRTLPLAGSVLASMLSAIGVIGFSAHYYAYGFHYLWNFMSAPLIAVIVSKMVIPVLYQLKVTSVFEYLRMRYGNKIGLTACGIYFFISVTIGAVALFTASVAVSTIFNASLSWSTVGIGIASTIYTSLGGMRGVVWTDCVQSLLILMAPITVVTKVIYDSHYQGDRLRPANDFNIKEYMFDASLDFTKDENVWACMIGLFVHSLFRSGMDQVVVQRYLAARKLKEAQRCCLSTSRKTWASFPDSRGCFSQVLLAPPQALCHLSSTPKLPCFMWTSFHSTESLHQSKQQPLRRRAPSSSDVFLPLVP